jgi:hypothetical protein
LVTDEYIIFRETLLLLKLDDSVLCELILKTIYENEIKLGNQSPCFMILLDEIGKLNNDTDCVELCSFIGSDCLDVSVYGLYDVLITALDSTILVNCTETASRRGLKWIPLNSPGIEIALKLFPPNDNPLYLSEQFQFLLLLSSNHWRTLELIKSRHSDLVSIHLKNKDSYDELVDFVVSNMSSLPFDLECLFETIIAEPRKLTHRMRLGNSIENLIRSGYFLNTITSSQEEIIPKMSTLVIEHWSRSSTFHIAFLLKKLFNSDKRINDPYSYETFHTYWEAIRRFVFVSYYGREKKNCLMDILDLYNGKGISDHFENIEIIVEKVYSVNDYYSDIQVLLKDKYDGNEFDSSVTKQIYLLAGRNSGFDTIIFHKDRENKKMVIITISVKYDESDESVQYLNEIEDDHIKTLNQFPENLRKSIYFVAVCWRNPQKSEYSSLRNTIILTKPDLKNLYNSFSQSPLLRFQVSNILRNHSIKERE